MRVALCLTTLLAALALITAGCHSTETKDAMSSVDPETPSVTIAVSGMT